ncbi:N-acetylglutamate synthase, partial [Saccharata proteae CBS 121410]
ERDFILSVLSTSATKRDARSYLARYKPQSTTPRPKTRAESAISHFAGKENHNNWRLKRTGVNLGNLYTPATAIKESPVFAHQPLPDEAVPDYSEPLHIALVKIRAPERLDEATLRAVSRTLSQLVRLGLSIAVVVDCDDATTPEAPERLNNEWRQHVNAQADRLVEALNRRNPAGAMRVTDSLALSPITQEIASKIHVRGGVEVEMHRLLMPLLRDGTIPVVPPIAYSKDTQRAMRVQPDDVMLALTREFAGIRSQTVDEPGKLQRSLDHERTSLEKIIIMDPLGGIPFPNRNDRAHVFINLEQEYEDIRQDLLLAGTNRVSNALYSEGPRVSLEIPSRPSRHIKNLDLVQRALTLLPPASSALIINPSEAASSAVPHASSSMATPGVRTRQQKNPLIHNLLTDKPMVSSSLPDSPTTNDPAIMPATFVKRGMPLTIIPDPRTEPWMPPKPGTASLSLEDPRIDFPRLLNLIEDSFGRKLDVHHYLDRIKNRLAGIIIAGEYEGGAILTWEDPPFQSIAKDVTSTKPESTRPPVPYLDKFAVLKRAQGAGGVADVVFKAMVRSCLPGGVVWRSRRDNPVNKWYFERSVGTLNVDAWDGSQWTMFWTTQGVEEDAALWNDMRSVCWGIRASWEDKTKPDD